MSKSMTPLARFSRDPVLRNALKLSAADAGNSFAVSEAITPELIAAYGRWLDLEHRLLKEEMPAGDRHHGATCQNRSPSWSVGPRPKSLNYVRTRRK
jgi:hypothetical protein